MSTVPAVSVVVPTRDRPGSLATCLAALGRLQGDGRREIVVVDDGSVTAARVEELVAETPGATLVRLPGNGPSAARNAGVAASSGAIVCFTDDDCAPEPGWAAALVAAIEAGADVAGGRTLPGRGRDPLLQASETIVAHVRDASGGSFLPTNNLAARRSVLLEHPFDERYPIAAGEDRDWCARVVDAGARLVFEPGAVVAHAPPAGLRRFVRQHARYGRGAYRFRRHHPAARRQAGSRVALLRAGLHQGPLCACFVGLAQLATTVGYLAEWGADSRDRQG